MLEVLKSQVGTFEGLSLFLEKPPNKDTAPNQVCREAYIIRDSIKTIKGKIQKFDEMYSGVDDMAKYVCQSIGIRLHMNRANPLNFLEHRTHRVQQRPSRSRNSGFHHSDCSIPASVLRRIGLWHEHLRRAKFEPIPVAVLGLRHPIYHRGDGIVRPSNSKCRMAPPNLGHFRRL